MPLHPTKYAELLGEKMRQHNSNIWLVNTGWSGGAYGVGARINLKYTRAMITAALNGELENVECLEQPIFGLSMPTDVAGVPNEILNPRNTWSDKEAYDAQANKLASQFVQNFEKFNEYANDEILEGAPRVGVLN